MNKKAYFFIDDTIWVFRDLTRQRPKSMFDNPFLKLLKEAHDKYGAKTQLNVFYRTDFFYGEDEFSLADMTDAYKAEWTEASDWLKMGFHSKQEFPDYPYVNATYEDVKTNLDNTKREVIRFAGEKSFAYGTVTHWLPISREGCRALKDGGIKILSCTAGDVQEYNGDPFTLPYGHSARLIHNRRPETKLYTRGGLDKAIQSSICAYNHVSDEVIAPTIMTTDAVYDKETGLYFKNFCNAPCLNLCNQAYLEEEMQKLAGAEFIGHGTHEQYFYPDYFNYQPDYSDKLLAAARILCENGYEHIFIEDLV